VAELVEARAMGAHSLAVMEEGSEFGFDSAGHDVVHDLAWYIDGAIVCWGGVVRVRGFGGVFGHVAQVVIPGEPGPALRFRRYRPFDSDRYDASLTM
jgi:hypothetical protein